MPFRHIAHIRSSPSPPAGLCLRGGANEVGWWSSATEASRSCRRRSNFAQTPMRLRRSADEEDAHGALMECSGLLPFISNAGLSALRDSLQPGAEMESGDGSPPSNFVPQAQNVPEAEEERR